MKYWVYLINNRAGGRWVNAIDMDRAREIFAAQEGIAMSRLIAASKSKTGGVLEP